MDQVLLHCRLLCTCAWESSRQRSIGYKTSKLIAANIPSTQRCSSEMPGNSMRNCGTNERIEMDEKQIKTKTTNFVNIDKDPFIICRSYSSMIKYLSIVDIKENYCSKFDGLLPHFIKLFHQNILILIINFLKHRVLANVSNCQCLK